MIIVVMEISAGVNDVLGEFNEKTMSVDEVIYRLQSLLPEKVSLGEILGVDPTGPLVYEDDNYYAIEFAINAVKKLYNME